MTRSTSVQRLLGVGALVVLAMIAWWWLAGREEEKVSPASKPANATSFAPGPGGRTGSIRPLSTDPATPPLEWGREDAVVTLPDEVPPLHELVMDEESLEDMMELLEWAAWRTFAAVVGGGVFVWAEERVVWVPLGMLPERVVCSRMIIDGAHWMARNRHMEWPVFVGGDGTVHVGADIEGVRTAGIVVSEEEYGRMVERW